MEMKIESSIKLCDEKSSQTNYDDSSSSVFNIFFCTFQNGNDVETYCDFPPIDKSDVENNEIYSKLESPGNTKMIELAPTDHGRPKVPPIDMCDFESISEITDPDWKPFYETSKTTNLKDIREMSIKKKLSLNKTELRTKITSKIKGKKLSSSKKRYFPCCECSETFATFHRLRQHAKVSHNLLEFTFKCDLCSKSFTRPDNLDRHKRCQHSENRQYNCKYCNKVFKRKDSLMIHVDGVHFKKDTKAVNVDSNDIPYRCEYCKKGFVRELNYNDHISKDLKCEPCFKSFLCQTLLRIHVVKEHETVCDICNKVCRNVYQLYAHKQIHNLKYKCTICSKAFAYECQYNNHLSTHSGMKPYECKICGKFYSTKAQRYKHMWQDHDEKNKKFKCSICVKSFVYKAKLKTHMRSHTGEKPYTCTNCGSTFSQSCGLKAHIRSVHGVYVQAIKEDGTIEVQLLKYKRPSKKVPKSTLTTESQFLAPNNHVPNSLLDQHNINEIEIDNAKHTDNTQPSQSMSLPGNVTQTITITHPEPTLSNLHEHPFQQDSHNSIVHGTEIQITDMSNQLIEPSLISHYVQHITY